MSDLPARGSGTVLHPRDQIRETAVPHTADTGGIIAELKRRLSLPLNIGLPLSVILFAVIFGLWDGVTHYRSEFAAIESRTTERMTRELTSLKESIEYLYSTGALDQVERELNARVDRYEIEEGLVADDTGRVIASPRQDLKGLALHEALGRLLDEAARTQIIPALPAVQQDLKGWINFLPDGNLAVGIHPVTLGAEPGAAQPQRIGILYEQRDVSLIKQRALADIRNQTLVRAGSLMAFSLLLVGFLRVYLTRRMQSLLQTTRAFAEGQFGVRTGFRGNDEISRIGAAFDAMADQVEKELQARRDAEVQGRESHRKLTALVENLQGVAYRTHHDANWTMDFASGAVFQQTGYTPEDFISGRVKIGHLIHPDDVSRMRTEMRAAALEHRPYRSEYRLIRKDGTEIHISDQGTGIFDEQGNLVAMEGYAMDITDRKKAEAERERLQRQLQQAQKMQAIGQLTGGVAHDFNNLLMSILGYTDLGLERFGADPELKGYLEEIRAAGRRAGDLVARMLAFSRGLEIKRTRVSLASVIEESVHLLRPVLPSSVEIEVGVDAGTGDVSADAGQVQQMLMNLCINARDAMAGQGRIRIALRQTEHRHRECASCHEAIDGPFAELSIADDGQGIDAETLSRIFEPFYTTKEIGKGSGMGLSMVHGITHDHGGHLLVESRPGVGSTFRLLFPLLDATAGPHALNEDQQSSDASLQERDRNRHILVVDDEPAVARLLDRSLTRQGYLVTAVTNAAAALERFSKAPATFDLLITDQTMPGMTGLELASRCLGLRPRFPILLCTGYSAAVDDQKIADLGIQKLLQKPVQIQELLEQVSLALNKPA